MLIYFWFFFFFCFKQKTAYEMRISDWSSDVCSSDLQPRHPAHARDRALRGGCRQPRAPAQPDRQPGAGGAGVEIGRASCRERVCSVRVDLGGRRIIKKKKVNITTKHVYTRNMNEKSMIYNSE